MTIRRFEKNSIDENVSSEDYGYEKEGGAGRWLRIWSLILLFLVLLAAVSVRITDINVIGNETYTSDEIKDMIFDDPYDRNSLLCFLQDKLMEHKELPFIQDYDIRFRSPFSCDLIVYEKTIVGCLTYMSSYMYFDRDGIIVENSTERLEGVPEVTGLQFGHIVLNKRLPIEDDEVFSEIMNITQQLDAHDIESDTIDFDARGYASIVLTGGDIVVELGPDQDMDAKILVLSDILPEIRERGLSGTLDLSTYSETDRDGDVSLKLR